MYHLYHTEAFVLDERPSGEANKVFYLLTPELGLVTAAAQGIRLLGSKLRYQIAKYALVRVSLVRGKEIWRLVGTEREISPPTAFAEAKKNELAAKIFTLLSRYVRGESQQLGLFSDLKRAFACLAELPARDNAQILQAFELAAAIRILHFLGYVKDKPVLLPVLSFREWNYESLLTVLTREAEIIQTVNEAQSASHI